jgi:menaquinone-dependent protoporphyrinogen oxidase
MQVLVAYASRHGATQGIAERIAETLRAKGLEADARPAASVKDAARYDAFVVGSAAYMTHWMKEARAFVDRNRATMAAHPVWLFSSGPIGSEPVNEKGVDQKVASMPKEAPDLVAAVGARDFHIFFGAYDPDREPVGLAERLGGWFISRMPAARDAIPSGDFRDWPEIEAWATGIARDLEQVPVG